MKNTLGLGTASAAGLLALAALGIARLEIAQPLRDNFSRDQALEASDCLPKVELSTGTAITLLPVPPALKLTDGKEVLQVATTGPVEVRLPGPPGAANAEVELAGKTVVLTKASGAFELRLRSGQVLVHRGDSTLRLLAPARFAPADDTDYPITVESGTPARAVFNEARKAIVQPGTVLGTIALATPQAVVPLQPVGASVWIVNAPPTLLPLRVSGQPGLADLSIEASRSGLRADQPGASLAACAFRVAGSGEMQSRWISAGVTQPAAGSPLSGKVMLALPSLALPAADTWMSELWIAVASSDGRNVAVGGVQVIGRIYAALIATVLTAILLGTIMYTRGQHVRGGDNSPRWFAGLFIGPDNDPSLSLLQIFIWTTITIWGFFYVFIVAGNLLALTAEMLGLLGIAGAGSVLARWIAVSGSGSTSEGLLAAPKKSDGSGSNDGNDFWRMLSTGGHFDLMKLQLFAFTIVIALYVVWRVADAAAFPALDTNTLLLLGVSQGVYVSSKLVGTSQLSNLQAAKAQLDLSVEAGRNLEIRKQALQTDQASLQAAGSPDPARLDAIKAEVDSLTSQIAEIAARTAALQAEYEKGLLALGLKRA